MGPRCAPTLILAVLQPPNSQSEKPILKSSWHLTACRYHAFFFVKQDRKGWGVPGIFGKFLRFSLLGISATQSLAFPSPRDRKVYEEPDGATISSVRPHAPLILPLLPVGGSCPNPPGYMHHSRPQRTWLYRFVQLAIFSTTRTLYHWIPC